MKMRLGVKSEFIIPVLSLSYQLIIFWSQLYWSQEGLEDVRSSWERQPLLAHAKQIIVTALANKDCHCLLVLQKTFKWLLSKFFPKYIESWLKVIFNKKKFDELTSRCQGRQTEWEQKRSWGWRARVSLDVSFPRQSLTVHRSTISSNVSSEKGWLLVRWTIY